MKDFNGKELTLGDKVAYVVTHYSTLRMGYIVKLTPKGCNISPRKDAESGLWRGSDQVCLVESDKPKTTKCPHCEGWGCSACCSSEAEIRARQGIFG